MKNIVRGSLAVAVALAVAAPASVGFTQSQPIVYPAKGQSEAKMNKDKSECHAWAQKQTGIDPAAVASAPPPQSATSGPKGGRLRGGARGAAGGAAVGAIAGDAGKGAAIGAVAGGMRGGMKQRQGRREEKEEAEQAGAKAQQQKLDTFNRAYSACLEGRGYTVK